MEFESKFYYAREKYFESMQEMYEIISSEIDRNKGSIKLPGFDEIEETPDSIWTMIYAYAKPELGEITEVHKNKNGELIIESIDLDGTAMLSSKMCYDNYINVCDFIAIYRDFEMKKWRSLRTVN